MSFGDRLTGCMKTISCFLPWLLLFSSSLQAQHKYGFMAHTDEELLTKARSPEIDAVVLACVYKLTPPPRASSKARTSYATVIESYKGPLAVDQKIAVVIYAEGGPTQEQELGTLRFFFLRAKKPDEIQLPDGAFSCEWTDAARYDEYGEPMRKLLRDNLTPTAK